MEQKELRGHCAVLGAEIFWGALSPATKLLFAGGIVGPLLLMDLRFFGAAALFWLFSPFMKKEHVPHGDMLKLFFASLLGIVLNQGTFTLGVSLTSPIDASICTTSMPLFAMVIAAVYLKEPITRLKVLGIVAGASGAVLLVESGQSGGEGGGSLWGDLFVLLAQCSFACYLVFFKDLIARYSAYTLMKWMFTYASLCILPFSYDALSTMPLAVASFGGQEWLALVEVIAGGTFMSYLLIPVGQKVLRPTVTAIYNYVQPLIASIIAIMLGLGSFNFLKGVAVVLVILGVTLVTRSKSRAQIEAYDRMKREGGA